MPVPERSTKEIRDKMRQILLDITNERDMLLKELKTYQRHLDGLHVHRDQLAAEVTALHTQLARAKRIEKASKIYLRISSKAFSYGTGHVGFEKLDLAANALRSALCRTSSNNKTT